MSHSTIDPYGKDQIERKSKDYQIEAYYKHEEREAFWVMTIT